MKIIFIGTSAFAVPTLNALIDSEHHILGIVTQPDRFSGRGRKLTPSPVKLAAFQHKLPIYQPERLRAPEFINVLKQLNPDAIVIAAYGQILSKRCLSIPLCGCINIHPALLPKYRGAAPIQRAIINGEQTTGVTIMLMDEGEDTGDIILQKEVEILDEDTSVTLHDRLADIAPSLLLDALALATDGPPPHYPQDENAASHAPKLTKEEGQIDWSESTIHIRNLVRGVVPWPGAYTYFGEGTSLKIVSCEITDIPIPEASPGIIYITDEREPAVKTGDGTLLIKKVQPASKREMSARDFVNGYRIKTGDQFRRMNSEV